eukprot:TRINITY_DN7285_c0_g1_i1.p1 TRINITY_DN7285_c0_g1~~TRINITY_DN7285_c0_g1_i1.p1  ORF type:complete len:336 (+),score=27.44 TRINITY_DN7285_c0_g1_i1:161-1168(+)
MGRPPSPSRQPPSLVPATDAVLPETVPSYQRSDPDNGLWRYEESLTASVRSRQKKSRKGEVFPILVHWSATEVRVMLRGLRVHGKDFRTIHRDLPGKSVADCVDFFYKTKYKSPAVLAAVRCWKAQLPEGQRSKGARLAALRARDRITTALGSVQLVTGSAARHRRVTAPRTAVVHWCREAYQTRDKKLGKRTPRFDWRRLPGAATASRRSPGSPAEAPAAPRSPEPSAPSPPPATTVEAPTEPTASLAVTADRDAPPSKRQKAQTKDRRPSPASLRPVSPQPDTKPGSPVMPAAKIAAKIEIANWDRPRAGSPRSACWTEPSLAVLQRTRSLFV